jgi:hypothetical protein
MGLGFITLMMGILGMVMAGGGGIVAVQMTAPITDSALTIDVTSTEGFLNNDYLSVGSEQIYYTSVNPAHTQFIVDPSGRGYGGTTAAAHPVTDIIYSNPASVFNSFSSYNIQAAVSGTGVASAILVPLAVLKLLVNVFVCNFTFFGTDLAVLGYLYSIVAGATILVIAIYIFKS